MSYTDDPIAKKKVRLDLVGKTFGKLTVIEYVGNNKYKQSRWKCKCECGIEKIVTGLHLIDGHTVSCGHHAKYSTHNKRNTRLYRIWLNMKNRCNNPNFQHWKDYGGRGITVCDDWNDDFQAFYDWAKANGYADNLSIDRIDVNGNYESSNCRWATTKEQGSNKRNTPTVTYKGVTRTLREWSDITGINYHTMYSRYKTGKTPCEILEARKVV